MTTDLNSLNKNAPVIFNSTDSNCVIIGWNTTIPWDNPKNLISQDTFKTIETVTTTFLFLYVIGAPAHVLNMAVFLKQGLEERINLCLFLLAFVDLIFLTPVFLFYADSIQGYFTDGRPGNVYIYMVNNNVTGLIGFGYSSMLLSAVIATERCVCVLFPFRAQKCIPTKVLGALLVTSVGLVGFMRFIVTAKYRSACVYETRTGRISWQLSVNDYFYQNQELLNVLDGILYGLCMAVGCPVIVLTTTTITVVKLQQIIQWRNTASTGMSSKEIGVTKMLICLSIEFFILSIPLIILRLSPMFDPQLNAGGNYANVFMTLIKISDLCSFAKSCVNFFVYYVAGSRYRETLHHLLSCKSVK